MAVNKPEAKKILNAAEKAGVPAKLTETGKSVHFGNHNVRHDLNTAMIFINKNKK